jgi:outer membrane biosynthesis protein TonB
MYFDDLYDDRPDYLGLSRDYARIEDLLHLIVALMVALFFDIAAIITLFFLPSMVGHGAHAALVPARPHDPTRFVFMSPRLDRPSRVAPPRAEASDKNRMAMAPEHSPHPTNPLPYSRGNTFERVIEPHTPPPPRMAEATQQAGQNGQNGQTSGGPAVLPLSGPPASSGQNATGLSPGAPGPLGAAVRNIQRYVRGDVFNNPGGVGGQLGSEIQFDSKGVDFGPWLRRFIAQIKRNWIVPYAAMTFKGHVSVTFNVHRDGSITDLAVAGPCNVEAFNNSSYGAMAASNPTQPLPAEYPADHAFFTVTFFYNETPPNGYQ